MTLTSQRKTQIIEEQVTAMLKRVKQRADAFNEDGAMVGDITMPGPQRLDKYWAVTPDLSDVPLLIDPGWEVRIRHGLDRPPVNPYWKNLLRVPGLLESTARDFVRLNQQYADRYQGGTNEVQPAPLAGSPGLPSPQMAAPLPAQPAAGGGAPGYSAPPGMMP